MPRPGDTELTGFLTAGGARSGVEPLGRIRGAVKLFRLDLMAEADSGRAELARGAGHERYAGAQKAARCRERYARR
jgi:hypothetical protein